MVRAWLLLLVPAVVFAGAHKHVKHKHWTNEFDHHFRKYSKRYFGPQKDWRWFKAQAIAESSLNPKARSKVGAIGLMQIMPSTMAEINRKNPKILLNEDPKWNIAAGIYYDRQLYKKWQQTQVPVAERMDFSFASYNAGHRRTRKAYNKAEAKLGRVNAWDQVAPYTPKATRAYVSRINKLMDTGN